MKIQLLGTAAAEGWPAIFCECDACKRAKALKGKNLRTRSSCLLNDAYLVDFPPDTYAHLLANDLDFSKIRHVLVTHSHQDHFYPEEFNMRKDIFAQISDPGTLMIYGNAASRAKYEHAIEPDPNKRNTFVQVKVFTPFEAGGARVVPLLADHEPKEEPLIYLFTLNGKTLLYGNDTGYFPEATWKYLDYIPIDIALFDCTCGPLKCDHGHMGFSTVCEVKKRLIDQGCVSDKTVCVITHFSHHGEMLQTELEAMASPKGFLTAYDGMTLTV
jgi:phosphoribosyl 1,2-cyclic phosphate phosphodiesterase